MSLSDRSNTEDPLVSREISSHSLLFYSRKFRLNKTLLMSADAMDLDDLQPCSM